jgi:hypothetical protein
MLKAVVGHADEPDTQRHRGVPTTVDHLVEIGSAEFGQIAAGPIPHGVVVPDQHVRSIRRGGIRP